MTSLSIPQIIIALLALLFILNSIKKFAKRKKGQTFFRLFFNLTIWIIILFFSIYPKTAHILSRKMGFGENLNTLIFIGFIIVFIILFKIINKIERVERNISEIVRKEALTKLEKIIK